MCNCIPAADGVPAVLVIISNRVGAKVVHVSRDTQQDPLGPRAQTECAKKYFNMLMIWASVCFLEGFL